MSDTTARKRGYCLPGKFLQSKDSAVLQQTGKEEQKSPPSGLLKMDPASNCQESTVFNESLPSLNHP